MLIIIKLANYPSSHLVYTKNQYSKNSSNNQLITKKGRKKPTKKTIKCKLTFAKLNLKYKQSTRRLYSDQIVEDNKTKRY